MSTPYHTDDSSRHIRHAAYCASDLVFQTGAVVINDRDEVLLVEDSYTHIIGLPRSRVPHSLDDLLRSPLGYLVETGYVIDPLPLCKPTRRYRFENPEEAEDDPTWPAPELAFSDNVTTAPFSIALDIGYLPASNLPHLEDGRQTNLWWYGGMVRAGGPPPQKPTGDYCAVHFLPLDDAVYEIQRDKLYDVVAVAILRLFEKIWAATKNLPPELRQRSGDHDKWTRQFVRHPGDSDFYTPAMITRPTFPVATKNTTRIISYAIWPAADYKVQTGAVLFDKRHGCVYLAPGTVFSPEHLSVTRKMTTLPRSTRDNGDNNLNALLLDPFSDVKVKCTRLALPRLWKKYTEVPGSDIPQVETQAKEERTTDPFFVTFHTWWDFVGATDAESGGRQAITYWYAGSFDSSAPLGNGIAVPISEALEMLKGQDPYGRTALNLFSEMLRAMKDDPESDSSDL